MGAWGVGMFENDDAGDRVDQPAEPSGYLESSASSEALAAAAPKELQEQAVEREAWADRLQELRGRIAP